MAARAVTAAPLQVPDPAGGVRAPHETPRPPTQHARNAPRKLIGMMPRCGTLAAANRQWSAGQGIAVKPWSWSLGSIVHRNARTATRACRARRRPSARSHPTRTFGILTRASCLCSPCSARPRAQRTRELRARCRHCTMLVACSSPVCAPYATPACPPRILDRALCHLSCQARPEDHHNRSHGLLRAEGSRGT